jgi:phage terminase small subunit
VLPVANHKPSAVKELSGAYKTNPNRRNDSEPKPKRGIGKATKHLDNDAMAEIWDEVVDQVCIGVLGDSDRVSLEILCRLIYDMRFDWAEFNGSKQSNLIRLLGQFGMSPVDRQKLHVGVEEKKKNKFA